VEQTNAVDKLPPHARTFLAALERSDDPTPEQRARADASVRGALSQRGLHDLRPLAPLQPAAPSATSGVSLGLKLGLLALSLLGAAAVVAVFELGRAPAAPARTSEAPARETRAHRPAPEAETETLRASEPRPSPKPRASVVATRANAPARAARTALGDEALQRELRLVAAANELIRQGRFADTLKLLDRSEREVPSAALREERAALRILAACGLSPDERSLRARERFLQSAPQAVLAARVREACEPRPRASP
jgi:hypothetical protein